MPRISPLDPPYQPDIEAALHRWMPLGSTREPLTLFRVLHRHAELASRMRVLGAGLLAHGSLPAADRELVIARVCARCGCGYEWGVHASAFADAAGLTRTALHATVNSAADDPVWSPRQGALVLAVDELNDTAQVSESAWEALTVHYDEQQLIELLVLAGWYRAISYLANGLLLDAEAWATPFPALHGDD